VVNAAQVDAVVSGPDGIAATMDPEAVLIQCATVSASFIGRLGSSCLPDGRLLVDAPVSGGVSGAKAGALTIMASGPARRWPGLGRCSTKWALTCTISATCWGQGPW
jgi:3-hydroxyisobutyrate dehydrogenase